MKSEEPSAAKGKAERPEIRPTICSICNPVSHCGVDAHVLDGRVVKLEGSLENPHSEGTLCSKGAAGRQYVYHQDRIKTPLLNRGPKGSGKFEPVSWDEALDLIAEKLTRFKRETGPESVAFFAGYTKWMRPFLQRLSLNFGSPNYCSESSTCSKAATLATKLNYGSDVGPDLAGTKLLVMWSRNPFYSNTPVARRLLEARERGVKIIEVGPLLTPLSRHADIHLRIRPGASGALAMGLARQIIADELYDQDFVENWTHGFSKFREYADRFTLDETERITGVPKELIRRAARMYGETKPAAMMTGPNATTHHTNGLQNHRALTALIGLTGNFDITGGNRVGIPGWLYVSNGARTREAEFEMPVDLAELPPRIGQKEHPVWCEMVPEAQAMALPRRILHGGDYPVRGLISFGINHRMWPGSDNMARALKAVEFSVDVDLFLTDSAKMCDLVLPACSSFERNELKFYPQAWAVWTTPAIEPIGQSRSDVEIIIDLARRLTPEDELMAKGHEACIDWILKPCGLSVEAMRPHQRGMAIPVLEPYRELKYLKNGFATPSGKMEFHSEVLKKHEADPLPVFREPALSPVSDPDTARDYPLILTTGARLPMFVHSRTFRLGWTRHLRKKPMADMNPADAAQRGIEQGDPVRLATPRAGVDVYANLTGTVAPGVVNMYHGYPEADVNLLMEPDYRDPVSGYPGFKSLLCEISPRKEAD